MKGNFHACLQGLHKGNVMRPYYYYVYRHNLVTCVSYKVYEDGLKYTSDKYKLQIHCFLNFGMTSQTSACYYLKSFVEVVDFSKDYCLVQLDVSMLHETIEFM